MSPGDLDKIGQTLPTETNCFLLANFTCHQLRQKFVLSTFNLPLKLNLAHFTIKRI